jgi:peptidoglycan/xylan/chitin deacetylase (PgdA/CDA1 family)
MYHRVAPISSDDERRFGEAIRVQTVEPRQFDAQMAWLYRRGFQTISLDDLIARWDSGSPVPRRAVVITFDDGYQECLEYAVPVLTHYGFTATFYLVSDFVGRRSSWDLECAGWEFPHFDWADARTLDADGFTIGSHTKSHSALIDLDADERLRELSASKDEIESQLGHEILHLSYPFGAVNEDVRAAALSAGYRTACCSRRGRAQSGDDRLMLPRIEITGYDSMLDFTIRLLGLPPPWVVRRRIGRFLRRS